MMKKEKENQKGVATLFIILTMLFILVVVVGLYLNGRNRSISQNRDVKKIEKEYEVTERDMNKEYEHIMETNK